DGVLPAPMQGSLDVAHECREQGARVLVDGTRFGKVFVHACQQLSQVVFAHAHSLVRYLRQGHCPPLQESSVSASFTPSAMNIAPRPGWASARHGPDDTARAVTGGPC